MLKRHQTDSVIDSHRYQTKDQIFIPGDFFMFRSPLLPIHHFEQLQSEKSLEALLKEYMSDPCILEAIAVASPSLFHAIKHFSGDWPKKKKQQVLTSLLRYLLRMTTRSTPFGMFAGMTVGKLTNLTDLKLKSYLEHNKRTRPDMEWLLAFVHQLENRPEVIKQVKVERNRGIQYSSRRLELPFSTDCGQQGKEKVRKESISIQFSKPIRDVLQIAEKPVHYTSLLQSMIRLYPEVDEQKVSNLVWNLFKQEFLISSLRPPLTVADPIQYLLRQLSELDGLENEKSELADICSQIKKYDEQQLGKGLDQYLQIRRKMREIIPESSPLQVDLKLTAEKVCLNREIGEEVARAVECLWRLAAPQTGFNHLKSYHMDFLERYGTRREVPVLELLNDETGLGAPSPYTYPQSTRHDDQKPVTSQAKEKVLLEMIEYALLQKNLEVELTEDLIQQIEEGKVHQEEVPASLEIYVEVLASSQKDIDCGNYQVSIMPITGSQRISQSFGRFMDMLESKEQEPIRRSVKREQELQPDVVWVEGSYLPAQGRVGNVAVHSALLDYELSAFTNSSEQTKVISLEDITVGATMNRLYLKSRSLDKEIRVTASNMLNYQQSPNVYRFLREVSQEGIRHIQPFRWGNSEIGPFLPRVRFGRTFLTLATWNLTWDRLGLSKRRDKIEEWDSALRQWCRDWMVPQYVYLMFADHRILLDMENKEHRSQIWKEMLQSEKVVIQEHIGSFQDRWAMGEDGIYASECIIPLVRKQSLPSVSPVIKQTCTQAVSVQDRIRLPGSDWLFVKLYIGRERQNDFISHLVYEFAEEAVREKMAEDWFFMRYVDPDPHIRLRFKGSDDTLLSHLGPWLKKWGDPLVKDQVISRLVIDTYDRELERYGGVHMMEDAENVFAQDSRLTAQLLRMIRHNQFELSVHDVAVVAIVDMLKHLGMDFSSQLRMLDQIVHKDDYRKEFRAKRKHLLTLTDIQDRWKGLHTIRNGKLLVSLLKKRAPSLQHFGFRLQKEKQTLSNTPEQIIGSLVHMHCNRLMGVDREQEKKVMAFTRHTLYSQTYWRKKSHVPY